MSHPHGLLIVDKDPGCTSHDVVAKVRRALGTRKVGHAGTLDPAASGVLVVLVGEGTKLVPFLTLDDKHYDATITFGKATDSLDADGKIIAEAPVPNTLTPARLKQEVRYFLGSYLQRVPAKSAVKVAGQRLYRQTQLSDTSSELPIRLVRLYQVMLTNWQCPNLSLHIHCGKGFYIRAFARDLAVRMGTVAHLSQLRRTQSGVFGLGQAIDMSILTAAAKHDLSAQEHVRKALQPLSVACQGMHKAVLSEEGILNAQHGRALDPGSFAHDQLPTTDAKVPVILQDSKGHIYAIAQRENQDDECLRILRGFRT